MPIMPVFDLSHMINYERLVEDGELSPPYVFEFVFDVPYALPYSDKYLQFFVDHLPRGAVWFCVRHHQKGVAALKKVIDLGGHIRVGYEDSPFISNGERAATNVELVEDAVEEAQSLAARWFAPIERVRFSALALSSKQHKRESRF